ncbi:hypothetical protein MRS44_000627 [Fusarium solani]|uniref:uncharacterized protein n=1 Tax=Fusarium solani TaxID=169388 RepID=UPI0032C41A94|nr:hypothetical protein MRS44_000627 [Fusarium solani]
MTKSSVDAVHGSSQSTNGNHREINRSQQDDLYQRLSQDRAVPRPSLHLCDPAEPVNSRLQDPLHIAQPTREAVSLRPAPSFTMPKDAISAKDLAGIGAQFSAERPAEKG